MVNWLDLIAKYGRPEPNSTRQLVLREGRARSMVKNVTRGILNLVLAAAATWLANYIVDRVFGPDEVEAD